jgi:hypothetical protein
LVPLLQAELFPKKFEADPQVTNMSLTVFADPEYKCWGTDA